MQSVMWKLYFKFETELYFDLLLDDNFPYNNIRFRETKL